MEESFHLNKLHTFTPFSLDFWRDGVPVRPNETVEGALEFTSTKYKPSPWKIKQCLLTFNKSM